MNFIIPATPSNPSSNPAWNAPVVLNFSSHFQLSNFGDRSTPRATNLAFPAWRAHFGRAQHQETPKKGWWTWRKLDNYQMSSIMFLFGASFSPIFRYFRVSNSISKRLSRRNAEPRKGHHCSLRWRQGDNFLLSVLDFRDPQCRVALSDFGAPGWPPWLWSKASVWSQEMWTFPKKERTWFCFELIIGHVMVEASTHKVTQKKRYPQCWQLVWCMAAWVSSTFI